MAGRNRDCEEVDEDVEDKEGEPGREEDVRMLERELNEDYH